jgi:transposase InsO family protein
VTRESIEQYAAAVRARYQSGRKREKARILDEFCATTGYHRKAAIRLLGRPPTAPGGRRGRPAVYDAAVTQALKTAWEASDRLCGKRLAPFLEELVPQLERHGALTLTPEVRAQVLGLSAATIDRRLAPYRRTGLRRPYSPSRAAGSLKTQIPLRTFGDWQDVPPGSLQADLVLHCGDTLEGFHLTTLTAVDVATGWTECQAVWGKTQSRVAGALHRIRTRLPMALRELHTDNGSEFINEQLFPYCQREGIRFTRGRPYKKNDQAYVEQKNWSAVRRLVGYSRYSSRAALQQLTEVYELQRLYLNFFQPVRKLVGKERVGAKS